MAIERLKEFTLCEGPSVIGCRVVGRPELSMNRARGERRPLFFFVVLSVAVAFVLAVCWTVLWWQDRPLSAAEKRLERGEPREALTIVDEFLRNHPQRGRAMAIKARALVALNQPTEAIALLQRAGPADDKDLHAWAQALLQLQQWSQALPVLEQLAERNPDNPDILHELTSCRSYLGRSQAALESAHRLAELPGYKARAYLLMGTIHYNMGNERSAAKAWKQVLEHSPEAEGLQVRPDEFFLQYGRALVSIGRPAEALPFLERSASPHPTGEVLALMGKACLQTGDTESAVQHWRSALDLDPGNVDAREGLASVALQQGQPDEARKWLAPLTEHEPLRSSTAYLMERSLRLDGETDRAAKWKARKESLQEREELEATLDQFLIQSPNAFWARVVRAHRFAQQKNWEQAQTMLARLLKEEPQEAFVQELADAVRKRGPLPSLTRIPIQKQF